MSIPRRRLRNSGRVPILQIALIVLFLAKWLSAPSRIDAAATQLPRADLWVPNTSVSAAVVDGNILYIGGGFTIVGPSTGNSALLDPTSGVPDLSWPKVAGQVFTIVDDGSGGWFMGGEFSAVDGVQHQRLAHMLADGTLDPSWQASVDHVVWSMVRDGTTLYIGGEFSTVNGTTRNSLAALSTANGSIISGWNPTPSTNSSILAMDLDGTDLYVGGYFSTIGGQGIQNLARVNTATGTADAAWAPNPDSGLRSLLVSGTSVYAGGQFANISGVSRTNLAQLSTSAGAAASAWTPNPDNSVWALALDGTTLYIGGSYTNIASNSRDRLASFDLSGGSPALMSWNPGASALVMGLTVADNRLYAAGSFTTIGGAARRYLASFDLAANPPTLSAWNPGASDQTRSVVVTAGGQVLTGGDFSSIGGVVRNRLAAIDLTTGEPTAWAPDVSAVVIAMKKSGTTLYVGGYFTSIDGQTRNRLAAFDTMTGNLLSWAPSVDSGNISALEAAGSRVYASGSFSSIGGTTRNNLAVFDAATGALDSAFNPDLDGQIEGMSLNGGILYVTGYFSSASVTGRDKLAAFDTSDGSLTSWNPGLPGGSPSDILATDNAIYVAGSFSTIGVGGAARNNLAALDPTTGVATAWNPNVNGQVNTVAAVDSRIYVGGSFLQVDGENRERLAELDPAATASGNYVLSWNPGANSVANIVVPAGSGVYVGGSFYRIANRAASFSALFIDPPITPPTASANAATDVDPISATLNGTVNASGDSTTVSFEWGITAGGLYPNSSPALPGTVTGSANTAVSAGIAGLTPETTYYYRVVATNGGGTVRSIEGSFTTTALVAGTAPQITSVPVTKIEVGREYSYTVTASGSPVPSFHLDGSPPGGMVLDATTGVIRWTPATAGSYQVTVRAANGVLPEATQTFTIVVRYEIALPLLAR